MYDKQKDDALEAILLLKKTHYETIKDREYGDGRKQHEGSCKEYAKFPTIIQESVLNTETINTLEIRDVAIAEIKGAFLMEKMDENIHL